MQHIILSHKVKDFDSWKIAFDASHQMRTDAELHTLVVGKKSDDPGMVYIVMKVDNPEAFHKMFADPQMEKIMTEAGVISKPEMIEIV